MPYVTHLNTVVPRHVLPQDRAAEIIAKTLGIAPERCLALHELFRRSEVEQRFSVIETTALPHSLSLSQSMALYREHARELSLAAARGCLEAAQCRATDIDLVVTCSCTGLLLPSLSVVISQELGLRSDVRRIPITEAGCAGGASALARAAEFLRAYPKARALVLAVELPTLTLQRDDRSGANMVASSLFGDGAAAALLQGEAWIEGERSGTAIVATRSELLPDSIGDLGFDLRDGGLHIVLTRRVPDLIARHLSEVVARFLAEHGLSLPDVSFFAVHPGGRKVLESVQTSLGLSSQATSVSRDVLRRYGNQSSASVLFVLQQTLARGLAKGYGLLAAFGPGITVELSLLRGAPC